MRPFVLLLIMTLTFAALARTQTVADLIAPLQWRVAASSGCRASDCCCFSDTVNTYRGDAGEIYFNGSVAGAHCNENIKQDNLDPPSAYIFSQEFFGIDRFTFNLTNAFGKPHWLIQAKSASAPLCNFELEYDTDATLPSAPSANPKPAEVPIYALAFLGTWTFDKTMCASENPGCCCLDCKTEIKLNPSGHPSFFIEGHPSIGCRTLPGALELQDDFPFPHTATTQSIRVVGFLPNQDTYQITINTESSPIYTLSLVDQTVPQCSMFATMMVAEKVATSWTTWVAILGSILGAFLAGVGMYCWNKRVANSSKNADSKPLLNVNIDRERMFYN